MLIRPHHALRTLITSTKWIVGAVNYDEDLHFSRFYLRQSARKNLPPDLREFGYNSIIAIFHDFRECYYLPEVECHDVAERLVHRMLDDPDWSQNNILSEIAIRAKALPKIFPTSRSERPFANCTPAQLLVFFRKHKQAHLHLYQVARIPETLDRGLNFFTQYLRNFLRGKLSKDAPPRKLSECLRH